MTKFPTYKTFCTGKFSFGRKLGFSSTVVRTQAVTGHGEGTALSTQSGKRAKKEPRVIQTEDRISRFGNKKRNHLVCLV